VLAPQERATYQGLGMVSKELASFTPVTFGTRVSGTCPGGCAGSVNEESQRRRRKFGADASPRSSADFTEIFRPASRGHPVPNHKTPGDKHTLPSRFERNCSSCVFSGVGATKPDTPMQFIIGLWLSIEKCLRSVEPLRREALSREACGLTFLERGFRVSLSREVSPKD
jgi:hypothetical protein